MKGVITIAVGNTSYGRMATNLAMSVKHRSNVPVDLIYTESAFKGMEWALEMFDNKILLPNTDNPAALAMDTKLKLDTYSRFEVTVFLDADTIICPSKSVDELFELGVPFTAQCYGVYEFGSEPKGNYETWIDAEELKDKFYCMGGKTKIPQINSSLIVFYNPTPILPMAREFRRLIRQDKVKHKNWRGEVPDELCLNLACAKIGILPHQDVFQPIYMGGGHSKEYIIDNYIGLSVIGKKIHPDQVEVYNHFARYYAEINGLVEPLYFEPKEKPKQLRPKKPLLPHTKKILASIGGFGEVSMGGIINPSAWKDGDVYRMILRVDENLEGYKGKRDKARCVPVLATYNRNFKFISAETIKPVDKELMEDFRLYMDVDAVVGCCSVWDGIKWGQREFYVIDGRLKTIKTHYSEKDEKNWAWFYHDKGLHVYSVEPFVVRDQRLNKVVDIDFQSGWSADGFISCSTFPVKYENDYLMWVHKKQKDLTYLNSVMIFDGKTLKPKYFIPDHVLGDDMNHPLYISSCIVEDDRILIFGGEGGVEEMPNAALKHATVRIIDRKLFDNTIKQYSV